MDWIIGSTHRHLNRQNLFNLQTEILIIVINNNNFPNLKVVLFDQLYFVVFIPLFLIVMVETSSFHSIFLQKKVHNFRISFRYLYATRSLCGVWIHEQNMWPWWLLAICRSRSDIIISRSIYVTVERPT